MSNNIKSNKDLIPTSSLTILFYLTYSKREELNGLIQFLQKHRIHFRRLRNKESLNVPTDFQRAANYIAQSQNAISFIQFEAISQFVLPKVIVVVFYYQNQIWTRSRLHNVHKRIEESAFDTTWARFKQIYF